jgi:hypothetical protein
MPLAPFLWLIPRWFQERCLCSRRTVRPCLVQRLVAIGRGAYIGPACRLIRVQLGTGAGEPNLPTFELAEGRRFARRERRCRVNRGTFKP